MISPNLALAAWRLAQDAVTREVVEAMRRHGVRPLLIKGPVLERWLYRDGTKRHYGDIDLVVAPDRFGDAETALAEIGFALRLDPGTHLSHPNHEHEWVRGPHAIDLHRGIWGLNGDPQIVWRTLSESTDRIEVACTSVEVPNQAACALLVALHAVQHGKVSRPTEELGRALSLADERLWRDAARLAGQVDALGPFVLALERFSTGRDLVRRLELPESTSVEAHLHAAGETGLPSAFQRLANTATWRGRLAMLCDELWPSTEWMRQDPLARRPRGMAAAHLWRIISMCARTPRAWLAWRRAVARARRARLDDQACSMGTRQRIALAAEILLAYGRARRRMASEQDARRLVALTRRGSSAAAAGLPEQATDIMEGRRLGRAVGRALWMLPAQRGCLARSLVLVDVLQRRGIAAKLVIGAQADPAFHAHAWVELDGEPLLSPGGFAERRLAEL